MSDYIVRMDLEKINPHPLNEKIYGYNETEHHELKKSIEMLGLLEPLTITKDNTLVSGHRRLKALREIGWEDADCRIGDFENLTLSLVELNRYRKKTTTELLNEAEILKKEYSKFVKMGRPKKGEERNGRNWSIVNVSENLGVSTTNLKKLMSIKKYEPEMLEKIDMGLISIGKAYSIIREKYILNGNGGRPKKTFESELNELLQKYRDEETELRITNLQRLIGKEIEIGQRQEDDFYPTHPIVTRSLLERENLSGSIWEPACGKGDMSDVLIQNGLDVLSTDLIDRGYGEGNVDFLDDKQIKRFGKVDVVITNPPFSLGLDFVLQAKKVARKKICIFNKTSFLEGVKRYDMWLDKGFPLKTMYQFSGRITFRKNNLTEQGYSGMLPFSWFVFDKEYNGKPTIEWILPPSNNMNDF